MSNMTTIERTPFDTLRSRTRGDKVIWTAVVLLAIVSLLVVYSSTGLLAYKMYKGNTEIYLFITTLFFRHGKAHLNATGAQILREFERKNIKGLRFSFGGSADSAIVHWDAPGQLAVISHMAELVASRQDGPDGPDFSPGNPD